MVIATAFPELSIMFLRQGYRGGISYDTVHRIERLSLAGGIHIGINS